MSVSELMVKLLLATLPNHTAVAVLKPVPEMVMTLPPAELPELLLRLVTVATAGMEAVNWSALDVDEVPAGVVTVISQVPACTAGAVAIMALSEITVNVVAGTAPNCTALAFVKPLPRIATVAPPAMVPLLPLMAVTAGAAAALYVN